MMTTARPEDSRKQPSDTLRRTRTVCLPHAWEHHSSDKNSITFRCSKCGLYFRETKG